MGVRLSNIVLRVDGGDKAQKTLNDVSRAMNVNQMELKKLEAAYGHSSKDMDYLAQRSDLLKVRLQEQEKATAALRETREKYIATGKASQEQLDKLDKQILTAETSEARLGRQIRECEGEINKQRAAAAQAAQEQEKLGRTAQVAAQGQKALGDAARAAGNDADDARTKWNTFMDTLEKRGAKVEKVGKAMRKALTIPILGMGVASGTYAVQLEDALYETATLPGVLSGTPEQKQAQLDAYRAALLAGSNRSHTDVNQLASAQYQAISASVTPEESAYWAERAAMAAKAGKSDALTVVDGASSVVNAWKEASGGLDHVLDVMLIAQNFGKTDVGQLASQVGQVTGMAPQVGVGMEEVFASIAAMTLGGMSTSGSVTGLKAVMSSVIKPTAEAREEAERLGLQFDATAMQSKGLTGFLADVAEKTGMNVDSLGKLFGSVEGLNQVLALGTSQAGAYAEVLGQMQSASGVLDEAFETRVSSRAERLSGSLNRLKNAGAELGEAFLPAVDMAADVLDDAADAISGMDEGAQKTVIGLGMVTAAAGPATKVVGALLKNIKSISALASNPWVLGAVGIGALAFAVSSIETDAEQMERVLGNLSANLSPEAKENITNGINAGIEAAEKEFAITARAKVELDGEILREQLQGLVDQTLDDGNLSFGEYSSWQAFVSGKLNPDVVEGLRNEKTAGIATELQGAIDEMNRLLEVVYRAGNSATAQEIADLETAIAKVQELHGEMSSLRASIEAGEDAVIDTQGDAGVVVAKGLGLKGQAAEAAAFTAHTVDLYNRDLDAMQKAAEQAYTAEVAVAQTQEEVQAAQAKLAEETAKNEQLRQAVASDATASYGAQLSGQISANPEAWAQMQHVAEILDVYSAVIYMQENDMGADQLGSRIPVGALGRMGYQQFEDAAGNPLADVPMGTLLAVLPGRMEDAAVGMEENPLMEWVQTWLDEGIDPSALDTSGMEQDLADVLRLIMAMQDVDSIGTEAMEKLDGGMEAGADAVEDAAEGVAGRVSDQLKKPGQAAYGQGKKAADDIASGLSAGTPGAAAAAAELGNAISAALALAMPGDGLNFPGGGSVTGGVTNNSTDNSVNVTIQNANMNGTQQANNMADRLAAYSRMKNAGVGLSS